MSFLSAWVAEQGLNAGHTFLGQIVHISSHFYLPLSTPLIPQDVSEKECILDVKNNLENVFDAWIGTILGHELKINDHWLDNV